MKKILCLILRFFAKRIIHKYAPVVIGITGSVGKTSTKEAIFTVLRKKCPGLRQNIKNYNNEIGLPLTIIGVDTGGTNLIAWLKIFIKAAGLLFKVDVNYPKILILEMGADKPNDIEYLIKIAPCQIGVLTKIGTAHIEFFGSIEKIAEEKQKIISHLDSSGFAIVNFDDAAAQKALKNTSAQIITFGVGAGADVRALESTMQSSASSADKNCNLGLSFKLNYNGSSVPAFLPNIVGVHQIYPALAAASVGISLGMNLVEISEALRDYLPPKGRMNLIKGINNSLIIDDTYNASPEAAVSAIETLAQMKFTGTGRKIAALGDMLELGDLTEQSHYNVGKFCAEQKIDILICSGKFAEIIKRGAIEHGLNNGQVFAVDNSDAAGQLLKNMLKNDDILLIKGSQASRMEKAVKTVMAEPDTATKLLVRQESTWLE
ncbi:UDP-N-acetylmuramoyl-tripeptide--D-alanyl-D-alanine ligase [Candidatus Falkowbacteria bacterium]|nr:UDP-N-acetylmuramoyl-tripeptide--D-alanyl-D-alanine ligase [Candidatus Falkowbacteria bacterium]